MATNKTTETDESVIDFINKFVDTAQKRKDSFALLALMEKITGYKPKMWGASIIGFGSYHYVYDSGHKGDAPLAGFSPRKAAISLYVFTGLKEHEYLLKDFGKYKMGKACIYVKRLADIDQEKLAALMVKTIEYLQRRYVKN